VVYSTTESPDYNMALTTPRICGTVGTDRLCVFGHVKPASKSQECMDMEFCWDRGHQVAYGTTGSPGYNMALTTPQSCSTVGIDRLCVFGHGKSVI